MIIMFVLMIIMENNLFLMLLILFHQIHNHIILVEIVSHSYYK